MAPEPEHQQPIPYPDSEASRRRRRRGQRRTEFTALSDESLIELTLAGSGEAFETLLHRYSGIVAGYLFGRTPAGVDAEDLAQEVFLAAHRNLDRLRNRKRFGPWLMKIARHRLFDVARERRRPETVWHRVDSEEAEPSALERLASDAPNPSEQAEQAEQHALLASAIGALGDTYRVVLYLRLIDNLPPHLIAVRLGLSASATRVRLHRGLEKLRIELARRGFSDSSG